MPRALSICVEGTAALCIICCVQLLVLCHGHRCFVYCMLCTVACLWYGHCYSIYYMMFVVGTVAHFNGHCCLIYCMLWPATYFCGYWCSISCMLCTDVCLGYWYWCCICYILCTAVCHGHCHFVPWAMLLHMLRALYCHMICALGIAALHILYSVLLHVSAVGTAVLCAFML